MAHCTKLMLLLMLASCAAAADGPQGPLTADFMSWLNSNGYAGDQFDVSSLGSAGSFGGRSSSSEKLEHTPVLFIHGNSDSALKSSATATGWTNSVQYFLDRGYTSAELYATSWGDTNELNAETRTHNCATLSRLRRFLEAVLAYTGSKKISIVTHSMGVTLGRKIVKGGTVTANDGNCNVGTSLGSKVDVFIGLSGANYGLCNCADAGEVEATCNGKNGLFPGDLCGVWEICGEPPVLPCSPTYSTFLMDMNKDTNREAKHVFSAWSLTDELIEYENVVWGQHTSLIPTSDAKIEFLAYTHMETKEKTAAIQFAGVANYTWTN